MYNLAGDMRVSESAVTRAIFKVIPINTISKIYVFGSAIIPQMIEKRTYEGWFFRRENITKVPLYSNDIDVLVFLKPDGGEDTHKLRAAARVAVRHEGVYGFWWREDEKKEDILHIITAYEKVYNKALKNKRPETIRINASRVQIY